MKYFGEYLLFNIEDRFNLQCGYQMLRAVEQTNVQEIAESK
jgi:hypothetical protein